MVRVKYRYILAEIVSEMYQNVLKLPIKEIQLKQAILDKVEEIHGDFGVACILAGFTIKMFNPATRVFIVRIRRQWHSILATTLPFVTVVKKLQVNIRTLHLSGTIRCAYKFLVKHDKEKMLEVVSQHPVSPEDEKLLTEMMQQCHERFLKTKFKPKMIETGTG